MKGDTRSLGYSSYEYVLSKIPCGPVLTISVV